MASTLETRNQERTQFLEQLFSQVMARVNDSGSDIPGAFHLLLIEMLHIEYEWKIGKKEPFAADSRIREIADDIFKATREFTPLPAESRFLFSQVVARVVSAAHQVLADDLARVEGADPLPKLELIAIGTDG